MTTKKGLLCVILACTAFKVVLSIGEEDIRCVSTSCKNAECSAVPARCNSTDPSSGIFMLSPDVCNCCEYCLVNIAENEPCSIGDPSNARHTSICGPGLTCVTLEGQTDGTCQKMSTPCVLEQQSYDQKRSEGWLGTMETRATCDDDGLYGDYKCIPGQTCHCLHSNGTRIFGDAIYSTIANYMTCACSKAYYEAVDILGRELHPHEHFRCASDGSYDRVQCINEKCLCVDAADGAPTFPNSKLVELEVLSNAMLSCYTATQTGNYYKKCEAEYMEVYKEVQAMKNESKYSLVLGYTYPKCDLDGSYVAVQENKTYKYCVDKEGALLTTPLSKLDPDSAELVETMDCKCARASVVMTSVEKPSCLTNGNYNPVQCRRGVCRCVDSDGHQTCSSDTAECEEVDEINIDSLSCS